MAEENPNETPEQDTRYVNFEETIGKTIESIEVNAEAGVYAIDINFTDNTALILGLEPFVSLFPRLGDFKTGELQVLKEWKPITSISLRE
ncbi:MAG TPA: hypothetical protein VHA33_26435 [Candidatus Angelobacter sp.]|jgi:hypothetical protein|nr:hypothetical protein [Candidatus Angelobacter sp.]